jgi:hypothetical protein
MTEPDHAYAQLSMRLYDAELDRDYFMGAARAMSYIILVDSGIEKPTERQVLEFIEKVGGRRDII